MKMWKYVLKLSERGIGGGFVQFLEYPISEEFFNKVKELVEKEKTPNKKKLLIKTKN